jgi:hypothetical protein
MVTAVGDSLGLVTPHFAQQPDVLPDCQRDHDRKDG